MAERQSRRWRRPWRALGLLAGLLALGHPLLLAGLDAGTASVPGGMRDGRLVHFSLEHSWQTLVSGTSAAPWHDFWNPPIYFPARNVAAYTDTVLTLGPLYWPWRALGLEPGRALQLWWLLALVVNYLLFELLLRRGFGLGAPASALGAFVFAFGSARMAEILHPQLIPGFYLALALLGLVRAPAASSRRAAAGWWALAAAALVAQAWAAFYPFYFFALGAALALLAVLVWPASRRRMWRTIRRHGVGLAVGLALAAALLLPLAQRYLTVFEDHGGRPWTTVEQSLPRWQTWLRHQDTSWAYGAFTAATTPPGTGAAARLHHGGFGLATTVLALLGLWAARRRPAVALVALGGAGLVLVTLATPGGISLWRLFYEHLPGAAAIRAVARVSLVVAIPIALGVAAAFDRLARRERRRPLLLAALAALVIVEQIHSIPTADLEEMDRRAASVARHVEPECGAFALSAAGPRRYGQTLEEDAMWAALVTGVPTVNGRYGNQPPGWTLRSALIRRPFESPWRFGDELCAWLERHAVDPTTVCWVDLALPSRRVLGRGRMPPGCRPRF